MNSALVAGPDPTSLAEWFRRRAAREPTSPALTFEGRTYRYGDLLREAEKLSAVLAVGGVGEGDRVAFVGSNHVMAPIALLASARIGAIYVPVNFRLNADELAAIVKDAGVHTLIADQARSSVVDAVRRDLPCLRYLHINEAMEGWESLAALTSDVVAVPPAVERRPDDVAILMYTSGTTGKPKGVMMSNDNIWFSTLSGVLTIDLTSSDVTLICLPLFHAAGLCMMLLPTLMAGAHAIVLPGFDAALVLDEMERHLVTVSMLVPTMMLMVSQCDAFETTDLSAMRLVVAGAAPVPEPQLCVYAARGIPVSHCYGMTESTSLASSLAPSQAMVKLGSCGRPAMMTEMRLIGADGSAVTVPGERGEVCLRGRCITRGYWNQPEATASAIQDGWLHSGDLGYFDEDGCFYICDRLKDMIISGGENVYPAEVESALYDHPAIAQVAVIGIPDERWGERVVAVAVFKPQQSLDLASLRAHAELKLARYKLPGALLVVDALPVNSSGKLLKTELRKRFASAR